METKWKIRIYHCSKNFQIFLFILLKVNEPMWININPPRIPPDHEHIFWKTPIWTEPIFSEQVDPYQTDHIKFLGRKFSNRTNHKSRVPTPGAIYSSVHTRGNKVYISFGSQHKRRHYELLNTILRSAINFKNYSSTEHRFPWDHPLIIKLKLILFTVLQFNLPFLFFPQIIFLMIFVDENFSKKRSK